MVNHKKYFGKSETSIESRALWINEAKDNPKWLRNEHLTASVAKYGISNFRAYVVEECSLDVINDRERYYIELYRTYDHNIGYNKTRGGDGVDSISSSMYNKEYWQRVGIRESRSGKGHFMYGKHHSVEVRAKMRESALHRPPKSLETREKMSEYMKENNPMRDPEIAKKNADSRRGKELSESHRRNIGLAAKGRPAWNKGISTGPQSPELIEKRSKAMIGHEVSDECREKIRDSKIGKIAVTKDNKVKYIYEHEVSQYEELGYSKSPRVYGDRTYHLTCKECGEQFEANAPTVKLCPTCKTKHTKPKSDRVVQRICSICGNKFEAGSNRAKYCPDCKSK